MCLMYDWETVCTVDQVLDITIKVSGVTALITIQGLYDQFQWLDAAKSSQNSEKVGIFCNYDQYMLWKGMCVEKEIFIFFFND